MIISLIAAMAENRVIGRDNKMPWDLPSDRKHFHALTRGHAIILGRKTFESIGRALSKRTNIVLTRNTSYRAEGVILVHDLDAAFAACSDDDEIFVCGGAEIFRETIPHADRIYLTVVHQVAEGDACFPQIPEYFRERSRKTVNSDVLPYDVVLYERT